MKSDRNKQHFKFFERANNAKPSERKQLSDFIKKKMNAQNTHLNGKNSWHMGCHEFLSFKMRFHFPEGCASHIFWYRLHSKNV